MAVTSYNFPGTTGDDATVGTTAWTSTGNITADDTSEAAWDASTGSPVGHYLTGTNYGFTTSDIPSGATIDGVEFLYRRRELGTTDNISTSGLRYIDAGTIIGTNVSTMNTAEWLNAAAESGAENITEGGSANLWSATITDTDARDSTSGIALSPKGTSGTTPSCRIDYYNLRYYYTAVATTAGFNQYYSRFIGRIDGVGGSV